MDVVEIVDDTAGNIIEALALDTSFNEHDLKRHYHQTPNTPFQIANNIDFTTLSQFTERSLGISGIQEAARPVRQYNYGAFASHIIGYVGKFEGIPESNYAPETVGKKRLRRNPLINTSKAPLEAVFYEKIIGVTS